MNNKQTIEEWQETLCNCFRGDSGVVGDRLTPILNQEKENQITAIRNASGLTAIIDSFQDFFVQTIQESSNHDHVLNVHLYALFYASFHRFRSCMISFYNGYPYDAAAGIRSLFENAFFASAVLNGHLEYDDLFSFVDQIDYAKQTFLDISKIQYKHLRGVVDNAIRIEVIGSKSGLSQIHQKDIERLVKLLHSHVHRAESSIGDAFRHMGKHKTLPPLAPLYNERKSNHFATPLVYSAWLHLRTIPFLSDPSKYSTDWKRKFGILDESFDFYVTRTAGDTADAIKSLIELKYTFDADRAIERVRVTSD